MTKAQVAAIRRAQWDAWQADHKHTTVGWCWCERCNRLSPDQERQADLRAQESCRRSL